MRIPLLALSIALAMPALAQTVPPPQTITFEGIGTPIPYEPEVKVPSSARIKEVALAGGGKITFRTRNGAKYAALVTKTWMDGTTPMTTTAIVGVGKKGKIQPLRYLDIRIRKAQGARFDAFTVINAGARVDTKGTTDTSDDETFYDAFGEADFYLYDDGKDIYPLGTLLRAFRSAPAPYDLTTPGLDFVRIVTLGDTVYDDLLVTWGP